MKSVKTLFLLALLSLAASSLFAQSDSDVLFTVGDTEVTVGEFKYIYSKSNGTEADFSKASVQEYLDLYERFKLKVARAREMGLDTIKDLQRELEGYRRQLADNYIIDRQVTDKLVEELYERQQQDIEFSHIFFKFAGNLTPEDTLALYKKLNTLKQGVTAENFSEKAAELSDDKFSKERGGRIGFVNAPFPKGLDRLESALYQAPVGEVVGPVQSSSGYHLAIKLSTRPALGEVEVGHILIRKEEGTPMGGPVAAKITEAKAKIDAGEDFAKVAAEYSEDTQTKDNAGYLGFFGINFYDPAFEEAAFALNSDGQVSEVVETKAGWHIIRRISRKQRLPLNDVRPLLENKVKADGRFVEARKGLIEKIRLQSGLKNNKEAFNQFVGALDPVEFASARWVPTEVKDNAALFTMSNGQQGTVADFQQYLLKNNRQRISMARAPNANVSAVAGKMYDDWLDEQLINYAESRLEDDYPEFAALMREYREGILLFEATKMEVWDKAGEDTTGLLAFYADRKDEYQWEERAEVTRYTVNTKADIDVNAVVTYAKTHGADAALQEFGSDKIEVTTDNYEYDRLEDMEMLKPEVGSVSIVTNDLRDGTATFYKVESLLPAGPKELDEARGYVIADYQDELERRWVAELRDQYPVKVNKKVLNKIIQ